jgi:hypothetical protein
MLSPTSILHFYLVRNTSRSTHTPNLLKTNRINLATQSIPHKYCWLHVVVPFNTPSLLPLTTRNHHSLNQHKQTPENQKKKKHLNCSIGHLRHTFDSSHKKGLKSNPNPKQST